MRTRRTLAPSTSNISRWPGRGADVLRADLVVFAHEKDGPSRVRMRLFNVRSEAVGERWPLVGSDASAGSTGENALCLVAPHENGTAEKSVPLAEKRRGGPSWERNRPRLRFCNAARWYRLAAGAEPPFRSPHPSFLVASAPCGSGTAAGGRRWPGGGRIGSMRKRNRHRTSLLVDHESVRPTPARDGLPKTPRCWRHGAAD